jgi:hypothetical protein
MYCCIFDMCYEMSITNVFLFLACNSDTNTLLCVKSNSVYHTATARLSGNARESPIFFCLPDCWLEFRMHSKGRATGRLDTCFLLFPLSLSKCGDCFQIPSFRCLLLMQPCLNKLIEIKRFRCQSNNIIFPNYVI